MSELSLPARAYLLACDTGRDRLPHRERVALLVRAAALTDLVLRGRITDDGGRPSVRGGGTGHLVLDDLLAELAADPHRKWRTWVRRGARGTLQSLEAQLDAAGVLTLRTSRVLGLFPRRRPQVRDPASAAALHDSVRAALRSEAPVPADVAALTSLAAAAELLPRAERRGHRERLARLEEQAGATVPALRKVIRELHAARTAAISAASGGGG